jgi:hypothetical protein
MNPRTLLCLCATLLAGCATQDAQEPYVYDGYNWRAAPTVSAEPDTTIEEAAGAERQEWQSEPRDVNQQTYRERFKAYKPQPIQPRPPQLNNDETLYNPGYFL